MGCGASRGGSSVADVYAAPPPLGAAEAAAIPLGTAGAAVAQLSEPTAAGGAVAASAASAASSAVGAAPGELLLGVAEHLPFIAPVAFLIGAVISATESAKTLKADAVEFGAFVASLEAVCQDAAVQGSLDKARDAIAQLRSALEEGLAHCQRLQVQTFAAGMMFSGSDARKFDEITTKMSRCIEMISMAAGVSTNAMVACKFEQGRQLESKLEELGGADAVARDPKLREQAQSFLDSSDQLLLAATVDVKDEVVRSRKELQSALTRQLDEQGVTMAKQHEVMAEQVDKLTTMLQAVIAMKAEAPPPPPAEDETAKGKVVPDSEDFSVLLAEPVPEKEPPPPKAMECDAARVRQLMDQTPVAAMEGKRRAVCDEVFGARKAGEEERAGVAALTGDAEIRALVDEAAAEFNMPGCWIGSVDDKEFNIIAGVVGEGTDMAGYMAPKEMSFCQHVVMGEDGAGQQISTNAGGVPGVSSLVHGGEGINGAVGLTAALDPAADLTALAQSGNTRAGKWLEMFGDFQEKMAAGPENVDMSQEFELTTGRKTDLGSFANFGDLVLGTGKHFSSAPIRVGGMAIGTLCVLDRKERTDVDMSKLQKIADRAAELLQKKRRDRGETTLDGDDSTSSTEPPASESSAVVVKITAADAAEHLRNPAQRVAVLLHTSNCRGCHELQPHWEGLAKRETKLTFATFSLDSGDVPLSDEAWKVDVVPAIVLVPGRGEQQTKAMRYPGTPAPATINHILEWLSTDSSESEGKKKKTPSSSSSSSSTAIVEDLGPVRGAAATGRHSGGGGGNPLEISEEQVRQIQLLSQVIENENLSEETRRVARDKMEKHTSFQIRQGEKSARLSQLVAERALEDQYSELLASGSLMPAGGDNSALGPAIAARKEFRTWLGEQRLLRHEASFVHVLGRDLAVEDLVLLEVGDVEELGWEMTHVERKRFEMAVQQLRSTTTTYPGSTQ